MAPQKWWACSGCGCMRLVCCKICKRASICPTCEKGEHGKGTCDGK